MKFQVPAFNVLLSLVYLTTSGVLLYVLKMAYKSIKQVRTHSSSMMLMAWLKRYTLACSFLEKDKKYLLKEYLILSTYAAACFNINHIIIWPITFVFFMLPLAIVLYEVAFGIAKRTVNTMDGELAIENVGIEVVRQQKKNKQIKRPFLQLATMAVLCFVGTSMFALCQMRLINSTSNSGELNIQSLLIILTMDQVLMRPAVGLSIFVALKVLENYNKIDIQTNVLVLELCSAEVEALQVQGLQADGSKIIHEATSSPLKRQSQAAIQAEIKPSEQMFIDFQHLQPYNNLGIKTEEQPKGREPEIQDRQNDKQRQHQEKQLEQCAYFTTPQKQMFEQEEESQQASRDTIVRTCLEDKQNCDHSINRSDSFGGPKQFEEFIFAKKPLQDHQQMNINRKGESMDWGGMVAGRMGRRKNKRVLKISGTSPYLEYLPNMLKKVDKFKHMMKESKTPISKML